MKKYSWEMNAIFETIAKKEGISVSEVVREMEIAIEASKKQQGSKSICSIS